MKIEWKSCAKVGVSAFLLFLCIYYWEKAAGVFLAFVGAVFPLFVGFVVAYLVNILMSRYEKFYFPKAQKPFLVKSRRPVCMLMAFVTLVAIIVLVIWLVLPQFISCVKLIIEKTPGVISSFIANLDKYDLASEEVIAFLNSIDWRSMTNQLIDIFTTGLGSVMDVVIGTVTTVFSVIVTAFLSIIFSIYLLSGKERLISQLDRTATHYIKKSWYDKIVYTIHVFNECFRRYIVGQCTEAVILGILCTLGMLVLQLPYATMIGAFIAFTALIPVAGAYVGAIVGAFMILTVSPVKALIFIIFILVLQQLEGNLIYPRVVGSSMGLPGIWVLASVTVGGGIMGIVGMLFGVPIAAALYRMIRHDMKKGPAVNEVKA